MGKAMEKPRLSMLGPLGPLGPCAFREDGGSGLCALCGWLSYEPSATDTDLPKIHPRRSIMGVTCLHKLLGCAGRASQLFASMLRGWNFLDSAVPQFATLVGVACLN